MLLHYMIKQLILCNIVKSNTVTKMSPEFSIIMDRFCDDNDSGFRDFIIDPIIYSDEILNYMRSQIRHNDEINVNKIVCHSMKILQHIMVNLNIDQKQEIIIKLHKTKSFTRFI